MMGRSLRFGRAGCSNSCTDLARSSACLLFVAAPKSALDVNSLASIPPVFKTFQITSNPAALTKRDAKHDKADKNPLNIPELRAYWNLIKTAPGIKGAALRLHLWSGGQRVDQISKLKKRDVSEASFTIYDNKGRPGQGPRRHTLPMTPQIKAAISELKPDGEFVPSNKKRQNAG
ncbi:hypothetical protein LNV08_09065 [Paucibacter sp. TC2R-5]|uniref:hypothetical protein n=1 Tax=Paucibacter sp. TC2R-5 TaxID=2893555 RepID=UPI0021E3DE74|nr:hypothetical protein [Paucibacter sp. TC2R-5]MCV2359125.1 hypothetical protein [Paucibacter sp. TC2R-5]